MSRMTTYIQQGARVTITAAANVAAGDAVKIGNDFYGVAEKAIASGTEGTVSLEGVYGFEAGGSCTAGAVCYLSSDGKVTNTSAANVKIGRGLNTVTSGGIAKVLLNA
jgi:predicted RecA/RadA family phage recombinase